MFIAQYSAGTGMRVAVMKQVWLILAGLVGLAAMAVPASAAVVYTLDDGGSIGPNHSNYGTVTLTNYGTGASAYVQVDVELKTGTNSSFVGTGAGYAITWNILGNPVVEVAGANGASGFNSSLALPNTFVLQDQGAQSYDATSGQTFSASPFHNIGEYAIDRTTAGNSGPKVTSLIFDVTTTTGLVAADFVAKNSVYFTSDIYLAGCTGDKCTGDVAVPEPRTWLLFIAGLLGLTMLQRRRKQAATA
jgi:hypothetical protein